MPWQPVQTRQSAPCHVVSGRVFQGSISTGADGPPKVNMPHNHLPDLHSVALARGRQADDLAPISQFLDVKFEEDPGSKFPLFRMP